MASRRARRAVKTRRLSDGSQLRYTHVWVERDGEALQGYVTEAELDGTPISDREAEILLDGRY